MTKEEYEKLNKQYMIAQEALTQMKHLLDHYAGIKIDPFEVVEEIEKNEPGNKAISPLDSIKQDKKNKLDIQNADYNYYLESVSATYAVHVDLMEAVLYHYVLNGEKFVFEKLKKEIKTLFESMDVKKIKDTIMVEGTIDAKYNTLVISDKLIYDCRYVLDILRKNSSLYYNIDDKSAPSNVQSDIKITTTNCNYHLTRLYKERDDISARINTAVVLASTETIRELEELYDEKRNEIERFLEFRRNHPDCALEGDPNYGPI